MPIQNDAKNLKMTETMAYEYSSESAQRELSNEYQLDRVWVVFKNLCILVLGTNVASALKGLISDQTVSRDLYVYTRVENTHAC